MKNKQTYQERLPQDAFEQSVTISKLKLANDQCFASFMGFLIDKEWIKNVYKLISNVTWSFKGDVKKFYPAFCKCISDAENHFGESLNKHTTLLLEFKLANPFLGYLSSGSLEKDSVVQFKYSSADLSDKEMSTVFYLAGCFFSAFSDRLNSQKKKISRAQKYLTIHTGKNLCFTDFSTKIHWNIRLAAFKVKKGDSSNRE